MNPLIKKSIYIGFVLGLLSPVLSIAATENPLEIAFQKEFAFLDQQRKSLESQTSEFLKENKKEEIALQKKLDDLKNRLISLELDVEAKQAILEESTMSIEADREDQTRLDQLFEQANASLKSKSENRKAENEKTNKKAVVDLYRSAIVMLNEQNTINSGIGEYFLPDGEKVTGTIINIGRVASYAIGEAGKELDSGMLIPAGDGKMKLWNPENTQTAMTLMEYMTQNSSSTLKSLDLFLYEDKNQAIEESADKSIMDIIDSGGLIAWVIVLTGGIAILMVLLRVFFLKRASKGTDKLMHKIKDYILAGEVKNAIAICEKQRGAAARVVTSTLRNLDRERDHLEDVVAESILHENNHLNRYGAAILVVAAVAPLMGLLGTVTGMIETFDIITQFGTGDPKLLSVGISTALVTTQLGLIVAIPALISGNLLSGWSNKIKDNMEQAALSVINLYGLQKINAANDKNIINSVAA